ncbi:radical SAM protein [Candidatus Woesearchaeota archaeon]|nr:radical SAM protein [Candidatus Woesearchaeota archaeon]
MKREEPQIKVLIRMLTGCNIACRNCYVGQDSSELSQNDLTKIVDELSRFGVENIVFTGGQPTLRREGLINIIRYAAQRRAVEGFPQFLEVTSNSSIGKSVEEAEYWAQHFVQAGLDRVRLSCDEWHREFLPKEYEDRFIEVAGRYGLSVKQLCVVKPESKIEDNIDGTGKKLFALRPGGRGAQEQYSCGWSNIPQCRLYASRHNPTKISIFIHTTKEVYICNVGTPPELSMGTILEDDLGGMLSDPMSGIVAALCGGDLIGLAEYVGADLGQVNTRIKEIGRCGTCVELRKTYHIR